MKNGTINGHTVTYFGFVDMDNLSGMLIAINGQFILLVDDPTDAEDKCEYGGCDRVYVYHNYTPGKKPDVEYQFFAPVYGAYEDELIERKNPTRIFGEDDFFNSVENLNAIYALANEPDDDNSDF